ARVLVDAGNPHVRRRTHEQTETTTHLGRTIRFDVVVEAKARLYDGCVRTVGVVIAVERLDVRVVQRLVREIRRIDTDAIGQVEVVGHGPAILQEHTGVDELVLR